MRYNYLTRKILYSPCLVSLALIPVLCVTYFFLNNKKVYGALEVVYWSKDQSEHDPLYYASNKVAIIKFTGASTDSVKLVDAQVIIRNLVHSNDTTGCIEFQFGKFAKYSALVQLFNLCKIEDVRQYAQFQDSFFIYNFKSYEAPLDTTYDGIIHQMPSI